MKLLSLVIGTTPVQLPGQINTVTKLAGNFGANIAKLAVDVLFFLGALLTFAFIFYGGFKWLISQGDKKAVEEARHTIIFSILGFVIMALAFLAISVIGAFFKVPLTSFGK